MFTMVIGASASGKSEYAEKLAVSKPGERIYLATMAAWDDESQRRIARHRQMRSGRGFLTVECPLSLENAVIPKDSNVLLEDLDNLIANEIFSPEGGGEQAVLRGVLHVLEECSDLTIVSGEVYSGGKEYLDDTLDYLITSSRINRKLAQRADHVIEVVCGCANPLK